MKIGLHLPDTNWSSGPRQLGSTLRQVVRTAEDVGFDAIAVADHLWLHPRLGGPVGNHLEAYATLGFIAAETQRVRLLAMATAASYRPAGILAKTVTTIDVLSGGRAILGIGSGDYPEEAAGLGVPFPASVGDRSTLLEETIHACLAMWADEHGSEAAFDGEFVHLGRALNVPQSLSRPHPPILIAGAGEKRTLPLVARYGDACNIGPTPELGHKLEVLRRLCDEAGRDWDAIEKTVPFGFDVGEDGSKVGDVLKQLEWLRGLGIETVIGWVVNADQIAPVEIMGRRVIEEVAGWQAGQSPVGAAGA